MTINAFILLSLFAPPPPPPPDLAIFAITTHLSKYVLNQLMHKIIKK